MHLAKHQASCKNYKRCMSQHPFRLAKVTLPKTETINTPGSHTRGCRMTITRRDAAKGLFYAAIAGAGTAAFGQEYRTGRELREIVAKGQNELPRPADFTRNT